MSTNESGDRHEDREFLEVNPCTEDGKVTLESKLKDKAGAERQEAYFDPFRMCEILRKTKKFQNVRCSTEIGYAIIEYEDMRIHVFKQGKIIIRRAKDRDAAVNTLQMISKLLSEAKVNKP